MPSLTLDYACGHHLTYEWRGSGRRPFPTRAAEAQAIAEASVGLCEACARQRANQFAASEAELAGLPTLAGTPKQVAWANTLRSQRGEEIETRLASATARDLVRQWASTRSRDERDDPHIERLQCMGPALFARLREAVRSEIATASREAAWWIDHRDHSADEVLLRAALDLLRDGGDWDREPEPEPVEPPPPAPATVGQGG